MLHLQKNPIEDLSDIPERDDKHDNDDDIDCDQGLIQKERVGINGKKGAQISVVAKKIAQG